jgi:hypothetical protein
MKVALIVIGITVLVLAAMMGGAYWWWQTQGPTMIADVKAAGADAARFAAGKDSSACVDEAASRAKASGYFSFGLPVRIFLADCLRRAKYPDGFCDNVPSAINVLKSVPWQRAMNEKLGLKGPLQTSIVPPGIQEFCQSRSK